MSESRLILVDGSGYIFRAYYALPPMNNSKGIPTNAVYGFCNMMLRLIDEHPNDKILIILDAGKNTFRNTLYSEYKANRSEAPEDLIPQFGIIREAIDAFGLDVIKVIKEKNPECRAVMLTSYGNIATAVSSVKLGADDYLTKPANIDDIEKSLMSSTSSSLPPPPENPMSADRIRWEHIQRVFTQCNRNVSETARRLKMHRRTLQRILNKHAPKE